MAMGVRGWVAADAEGTVSYSLTFIIIIIFWRWRGTNSCNGRIVRGWLFGGVSCVSALFSLYGRCVRIN